MVGIFERTAPHSRIISLVLATGAALAAAVIGVTGPQPAAASVALPGSTTCDATGCWTTVSPPPTPWAFGGGGVSCTGPAFCIAVGQGALRWNGTRWSTMDPGPNVARPVGGLTDVSCTSVSFCVAVGGGSPPNMWDGTKWSTMSDPNAGGQLTGVSCKSASFCIGVGQSDDFSRSYAETWNGSNWSTMTTAEATNQPDGYSSDLSRVSCSSTTFCMAIGAQSSGGPVTQMWNGHKWSIANTAAAQLPELMDVSCSGSFCVAVGALLNPTTFHGPDTGHETLAEQWSGGAWSVMTTTNPSPDLNLPIPGCDPLGACADELTSVSCTSAKSCVAVGVTSGLASDQTTNLTLAERWDGTTWSTMTTTNPTGAPTASKNFFSGVSCIDSTTCVAIGASGGDVSGYATLAELHSSLGAGLQKINPTDPLG